jgi:hypothetical protein
MRRLQVVASILAIKIFEQSDHLRKFDSLDEPVVYQGMYIQSYGRYALVWHVGPRPKRPYPLPVFSKLASHHHAHMVPFVLLSHYFYFTRGDDKKDDDKTPSSSIVISGFHVKDMISNFPVKDGTAQPRMNKQRACRPIRWLLIRVRTSFLALYYYSYS